MLNLMDTPAAANRLGLSPRTLERFRLTGQGPKFIKIGRRVAYRECDLEEFVEDRVVSSTAEATVRDRRKSLG